MTRCRTLPKAKDRLKQSGNLLGFLSFYEMSNEAKRAKKTKKTKVGFEMNFAGCEAKSD